MYKRTEDFFDKMRGKKVAFCGLGRSNIRLIDMFLLAGAFVVVCDKNESVKNTESYKALSKKGVQFSLGDNYLKNLDVDIVFRTPGISYLNKELVALQKEGVIVTSEMDVFFRLCPCKIYAITGSDGKTTTTTLISEMLNYAGYKVHLGGNIGAPLLYRINDIKEEDVAVVELSSFQLMSMHKSPNVCVVTNISPNHLDYHKDMNEYVNSKKNIIRHQDAFDKAVLNSDNEAMLFANDGVSRIYGFSRRHKVDKGAYCVDGEIFYTDGKEKVKIMNSSDILLRGKHNLENYLAAIAAVYDDVNTDDIVRVAKSFAGVEHRTEFVRELAGVKFYNDSIASSPTRTISGTLSLYDEKIIMIAGGYDKHIPYDELGKIIPQKVKTLILMGDTAQKIKTAVEKAKSYDPEKLKIIVTDGMENAVRIACENAKSGDRVFLSPASASFGLYKNFEERGNHFKELVNKL